MDDGKKELQMLCVSSPHRQQIDDWLDAGKSIRWISEQLDELGGYISPNSIGKYRKTREQRLMEDIKNTPEYKSQQAIIEQKISDGVKNIKTVDLIGRISSIIEDSATLLQQAKDDDIRINSVKDLRMVQQTMLDAIQIYGETMLNAQKYDAINSNPNLLQNNMTTINMNIKEALISMLHDSNNGTVLVDKLRGTINGGGDIIE